MKERERRTGRRKSVEEEEKAIRDGKIKKI